MTLREVGFFPPTTTVALRADLGTGIRAAAEAVQKQTTNQKARASLLPMGLRDKAYEHYDDVYRALFHEIVMQGRPIRPVLEAKGGQLQSVLDSVRAPCWQPDPPSTGTCRVGG